MQQKSKESWYWVRGLHDAVIKKVSMIELDYDYTKAQPIRNYLSIKLDSSQAMYDTSIKELRFQNAKMTSDMLDYNGYWWVDDKLDILGKKYIIHIDVRNAKDNKIIEIIFDDVVVLK